MAQAAGPAPSSVWMDTRNWGRNPEEVISHMFSESHKISFQRVGTSLEHRQYFEAFLIGSHFPTKKYFRIEIGNTTKTELRFYAGTEHYSSVCLARCCVQNPTCADIITLFILFETRSNSENKVAKARLTKNGATDMSNRELVKVVSRRDVMCIQAAASGEVLMNIQKVEKQEPKKYAHIGKGMKRQDPITMISALFLAFYNLYCKRRNGLVYRFDELLFIPPSPALQCLTDLTSAALGKYQCHLAMKFRDASGINTRYELLVGNWRHLVINVKDREPNSGFFIRAINFKTQEEVFRLEETSGLHNCMLYVNQNQLLGQFHLSRLGAGHYTRYSDTKDVGVINGQSKLQGSSPCYVVFRSALTKAMVASACDDSNTDQIRIQRINHSVFEPGDLTAIICMTLYHKYFDSHFKQSTGVASSATQSNAASALGYPQSYPPAGTSMNQPQNQYPTSHLHGTYSQQQQMQQTSFFPVTSHSLQPPNYFIQRQTAVPFSQQVLPQLPAPSTQGQGQGICPPPRLSNPSQTMQPTTSGSQMSQYEQRLLLALPRVSSTQYYQQF